MLSTLTKSRACIAAAVIAAPIGLTAIPAGSQPPGPTCQIDVIQPINTTPAACFIQIDLAQSFRPNVDTMNGAGIHLTAGIGNPGMVTIELWDALPNAGGVRLAGGSGLGEPGAWVIVSWPSVSVVPGDQYFLVFTADAQAFSMCIDGDNDNPYPDGILYANPGFLPFSTYDYTFQTCGFQQGVECPWDCGDGDGIVGVVDLLRLLGQWQSNGDCDFGGDGVVNVVDLLELLGNWGPCDACPVPFFCGMPEAPYCDPDETCICFSTFDGVNICIDTNVPCIFPPCPDGDCPPGHTCIIDTCCDPDGTMCLPDAFICMLNAAAAQANAEPGQVSITGDVIGENR